MKNIFTKETKKKLLSSIRGMGVESLYSLFLIIVTLIISLIFHLVLS